MKSPDYATDTSKQAEYIVNDAETRIIFVSTQEQYNKVKPFAGTSPYLKKIIVFDADVSLDGSNNAMYFKDFLDLGRKSGMDAEVEERLNNASVDDLASVIYTSGTTGEPKGVMLNHSTFYHCFIANKKRLDVSDKDASLCFLPLSHIFERACCYFAFDNGMVISYCDNSYRIIECIKEVKPTVMCAVPRFYEKIYSTVFEKLKSAPPLKKKLFKWAIKAGEQVYLRRK